MGKKSVLIVDDSALIRQLLTEIIQGSDDFRVAGSAGDPFRAREMIKQLNPDLLTLDVEMPRMDGLTFLENLMRLRPMPVLMVSSLTQSGADVTLQALELGAVDFVTKPAIDVARGLRSYSDTLLEKLRAVAQSRVRAKLPPRRLQVPERASADVIVPPRKPRMFTTTDQLVAIGSSTGGTEAVKELLTALPADCPATVISQHIPAAFSRPFAERMDRCSAMSVCEAEHGQLILPGHVYIAPGDRHLMVRRDGARMRCVLDDGPPVNRHIPSVDVLMRSVAQNLGPNASGVMLTGMGSDGAQGLLEMRQAGACTIAQDEATSVVWGMPGSAVKCGAVEQILPLEQIAAALLAWAEKQRRKLGLTAAAS